MLSINRYSGGLNKLRNYNTTSYYKLSWPFKQNIAVISILLRVYIASASTPYYLIFS